MVLHQFPNYKKVGSDAIFKELTGANRDGQDVFGSSLITMIFGLKDTLLGKVAYVFIVRH